MILWEHRGELVYGRISLAVGINGDKQSGMRGTRCESTYGSGGVNSEGGKGSSTWGFFRDLADVSTCNFSPDLEWLEEATLLLEVVSVRELSLCP